MPPKEGRGAFRRSDTDTIRVFSREVQSERVATAHDPFDWIISEDTTVKPLLIQLESHIGSFERYKNPILYRGVEFSEVTWADYHNLLPEFREERNEMFVDKSDKTTLREIFKRFPRREMHVLIRRIR